MKPIISLLLLVGSLFSVAACTPVQPWQKGHLAAKHMAFETDPLESRLKQHIYTSKEASSGGYGAAGGGCGCN